MSAETHPKGWLTGWPDAPVSIPREIAANPRISRAAVGLYAYLLTREEGAVLSAAALADELGVPLPQVNTWYVELKSAGLIVSGGDR